MADKQDGQVSLQAAQQVQDLLLNGDVQGRGGLVADQHLRPHGQGPGDGRPLALPAADLMGIAPGKLPRQAAALHKAHRLLPGLPAGQAAQTLPHPVP